MITVVIQVTSNTSDDNNDNDKIQLKFNVQA